MSGGALRALAAVVAIALMNGQRSASQSRMIVDALGDFHCFYSVDGVEQEYTYVTSTKIAPDIETRVLYDTSTQSWEYRFVVSNGTQAKQELYGLVLEIRHPVEYVARPADWREHLLPAESRLSWFGPSWRKGIPPGQTQTGFVVRSRFLPGIVSARVLGGGEPGSIPEGFPADCYRRVEELGAHDFIEMRVVTPWIATKMTDSSLRPARLATSIVANYLPALSRIDATYAAHFNDILERARSAYDRDDIASAKEALGQLAAFRPRGKNAAERDVLSGVELCIRYLDDTAW